jgi:uncharacterized protein DUF3570
LAEAVVAATEKAKLLRKRAAAAACTLLGIPSAKATADLSAEASAKADRWTLDTSYMHYSEAERITVNEPQVAARRDFSDNRSLNILVTVDTISGATPLGTLPATANTAPNTVTSASGRGTNPIIGKIPLSNMTDTRYAVDTSWQQPVGSAYTGVIGADASKESDYISLGANSKLARDFNEKNTTVSLGLAPEFDISNPNGGMPIPYATLYAPGSIDGTRDTKWLASALAGITQVVNRRTLMQFNYGLTYEHGYLTDPYKLLSIVNAQGDPLWAVYESRPEKRTEHSFYWLTRYNIWDEDVLGLSFRYYTDDWGIRSQTLDFTFHRQSNDHFYWEPHVRYYTQTAADFFRAGLLVGAPLPAFSSADLRLAQFDAVTFGVRFGYTLRDGSLLVVRAEYYTQTGESHPSTAIGAQAGYDLFPTLYASILQVDYHFEPSKLWTRKPRS